MTFSPELVKLAREVLQTLYQQDCRLAVAESCTGGLLGGLLTEVAGSAEVFLGGYVTYCNEWKEQLLNVAEQDITEYGAVSEIVAGQMVVGVLENHPEADYAISITGYAGDKAEFALDPIDEIENGKEKSYDEIELGLVYIGVAGRAELSRQLSSDDEDAEFTLEEYQSSGGIRIAKHNFTGNRQEIRTAALRVALQTLKDFITTE